MRLLTEQKDIHENESTLMLLSPREDFNKKYHSLKLHSTPLTEKAQGNEELNKLGGKIVLDAQQEAQKQAAGAAHAVVVAREAAMELDKVKRHYSVLVKSQEDEILRLCKDVDNTRVLYQAKSGMVKPLKQRIHELSQKVDAETEGKQLEKLQLITKIKENEFCKIKEALDISSRTATALDDRLKLLESEKQDLMVRNVVLEQQVKKLQHQQIMATISHYDFELHKSIQVRAVLGGEKAHLLSELALLRSRNKCLRGDLQEWQEKYMALSHHAGLETISNSKEHNLVEDTYWDVKITHAEGKMQDSFENDFRDTTHNYKSDTAVHSCNRNCSSCEAKESILTAAHREIMKLNEINQWLISACHNDIKLKSLPKLENGTRMSMPTEDAIKASEDVGGGPRNAQLLVNEDFSNNSDLFGRDIDGRQEAPQTDNNADTGATSQVALENARKSSTFNTPLMIPEISGRSSALDPLNNENVARRISTEPTSDIATTSNVPQHEARVPDRPQESYDIETMASRPEALRKPASLDEAPLSSKLPDLARRLDGNVEYAGRTSRRQWGSIRGLSKDSSVEDSSAGDIEGEYITDLMKKRRSNKENQICDAMQQGILGSSGVPDFHARLLALRLAVQDYELPMQLAYDELDELAANAERVRSAIEKNMTLLTIQFKDEKKQSKIYEICFYGIDTTQAKKNCKKQSAEKFLRRHNIARIWRAWRSLVKRRQREDERHRREKQLVRDLQVKQRECIGRRAVNAIRRRRLQRVLFAFKVGVQISRAVDERRDHIFYLLLRRKAALAFKFWQRYPANRMKLHFRDIGKGEYKNVDLRVHSDYGCVSWCRNQDMTQFSSDWSDPAYGGNLMSYMKFVWRRSGKGGPVNALKENVQSHKRMLKVEEHVAILEKENQRTRTEYDRLGRIVDTGEWDQQRVLELEQARHVLSGERNALTKLVGRLEREHAMAMKYQNQQEQEIKLLKDQMLNSNFVHRNKLLVRGASSFNSVVRAVKSEVLKKGVNPEVIYSIDRMAMDQVSVFPDGDLHIQPLNKFDRRKWMHRDSTDTTKAFIYGES
ncbi:hypothetical protein SELMODRAFT_431104 [Selaginella moellendorffii]|uniref:Uncharacterized protein n=1 Tax=Selaginella moellendorffii TaxID=88036 RepID=D8TBJ1_SELML|nr:hypothetical protein SELMODRAFT_431104 [Selaginella moellendorffii]